MVRKNRVSGKYTSVSFGRDGSWPDDWRGHGDHLSLASTDGGPVDVLLQQSKRSISQPKNKMLQEMSSTHINAERKRGFQDGGKWLRWLAVPRRKSPNILHPSISLIYQISEVGKRRCQYEIGVQDVRCWVLEGWIVCLPMMRTGAEDGMPGLDSTDRLRRRTG